MWGEVTPNTDEEYSWASYKYCNGSYDTLTKYNNKSSYGTVDNKTVLDPEDDAATQIMGGDWKMPTQSDFNELLSGTTNEWVTNYNGTGVNGRKFTSKTDESKYIFIPAAGYGYGGPVVNVGGGGSVLSSSLNASDPTYAWRLSFGLDYCDMNRYGCRCYGWSVRGVRK